jgi:hypothetical protein
VSISSPIDWADLSGLDKVVAIYGVGENTVIVETNDSREIRITAWKDLKTGDYLPDFERRGTVHAGGGKEFHVWSHTTVYGRPEPAPSLQACLEAAVHQVDRMHVY